MPLHAEKQQPNEPERCACSGGCVTDTTSIQDVLPVAVSNASGHSSIFRIPAMDCPNEENDIRKALAGIAGIRSLRFELAARTLTIEGEQLALESGLQAIRQLGFEVLPIEHEQKTEMPSGLGEISKALIALALAIGAEALDFFAPDTLLFKSLGMALAAAAIAFSGFSTYRKGLAALRRGQLNMNALMGVAVTGAFLIGQWPEAAMVMALYAIAELIEARSVDQARNAIKGLLALAPETAEIRQGDGSWQEMPADKVAIGALARVKPGARIPLDGRVTAGSSAVNQAPVTGESIPVDKATGDPVFAGTINETGTLEFEVTAAANNTTLARIIHAVEAAQGTRAPTQRFVDRFAAIYTPAIFAIAVAVAVGGPSLFDWTWIQALYKALVLLVIACPCALVIATPVTVVSGLAAAARRGILIKGGVYLENGRHLALLALDKTGTLTHGKPVQTDSLHLLEVDEPLHATWAASLAARSDHPVSRALAQRAEEQGQALHDVEDFEALPGRGSKGRIDGTLLYIGNHRLVEDLGLCSAQLEQRLEALERQGKSVVVLCDEQRALMQPYL